VRHRHAGKHRFGGDAMQALLDRHEVWVPRAPRSWDASIQLFGMRLRRAITLL